MTASAESIAFNIVEGCGSSTARELARFIDISIRSTMELEYRIRLAIDYEVVTEVEGLALTEEIIDTRRMLYGLKGTVLKESRE